MKFFSFTISITNIIVSSGLIQLDWKTLENEVTLRYVSPSDYFPSEVLEIDQKKM